MDIEEFEQSVKIMSLYIDSAKTYLQLATFALGFSVTFLEKLVKGTRSLRRDPLLFISWLGFILTVAFSSFYQYLAAKHVEIWLQSTSKLRQELEYPASSERRG